MAPPAPSSPSLDFNLVAQALKRGEIAFALGVITILVFLVLPLPSWLLDMALAFSLTLSVLVLMTALFIEKPLEFSAFPTVLLTTTMLRLSLNVASTRLILTHGHEGPTAAGEVIRAFADFIMSGNFVIGFIVFSILVIVNFVVITKGSGRIAEVSARFSLDAMPGKQMAIDADLSAGLIDEQEAKKRRRELEEESNFFGAMDGAAKFVRGDAIAGVCITFINIVGGIIIGVAQNDMSFGDATRAYTLLTVGDGLITQIPALIVSTAAGMLVSKVGSSGSTDKAFVNQLSAYPSALGLSSALMAVLSLLPKIPALPFLALSGITGFSAWRMTEKLLKQKEVASASTPAAKGVLAGPKEESLAEAMQLDQIRIELGYGLLSLVRGEEGGRLTEQIKNLRKQLAKEIGFILPMVRIQDNFQIPPDAYVIRVKEVEVGRGNLRLDKLLAMSNGEEDIPFLGEIVIEPCFGLQAKWISFSDKMAAEGYGLTVVEPATVLMTHVGELMRDNASDLLSFSEAQKLIDDLDKAHQRLVTDIVPSHITMGGVHRVLQNLLAERISIRDLPAILEAIAETCPSTNNLTAMTEHVRARLSRQITASHTDEEGIMTVVALSPDWEVALTHALVGDRDDKQLSLQPSKLQEFTGRLRDVFDQQALKGENPVLLVNSLVRPQVRSIMERFRPSVSVISQNEVYPRARIKTIARI